jgi:fructokinase
MLWDELPDGRHPGGAPLNVAYHLTKLGRAALPVSAVGQDADGRGLLDFLQTRGLPIDGVAIHPDLPTGVVRADLDSAGVAHYTIEQDRAWDDIPISPEVRASAAVASALVFGSLAQRSPANRGTLERLRDGIPTDALLVFDVNLRAPHDALEGLEALARGVGLLKVNHEEAALWSGGEMEDYEANARMLARETGVERVCVTAGAKGAGLLSGGEWFWEEGRAVVVADTIGAGDSFLAALIDGLLAGHPSGQILARSCRLGEYVASQTGAMPDYEPRNVFGK